MTLVLPILYLYDYFYMTLVLPILYLYMGLIYLWLTYRALKHQ